MLTCVLSIHRGVVLCEIFPSSLGKQTTTSALHADAGMEETGGSTTHGVWNSGQAPSIPNYGQGDPVQTRWGEAAQGKVM